MELRDGGPGETDRVRECEGRAWAAGWSGKELGLWGLSEGRPGQSAGSRAFLVAVEQREGKITGGTRGLVGHAPVPVSRYKADSEHNGVLGGIFISHPHTACLASTSPVLQSVPFVLRPGGLLHCSEGAPSSPL